MIDRVKIYVKAGDGGSGCTSFKGKQFTRSYHPDGGSGGLGADVIIRVDYNVRDLEHYRFNQHFRAENGKNGQANKKKGADRRPCIIRVPAGTIVRDLGQDLLLRELVEEDEQFLVAKGGGGGRGNTKAKLATGGCPGEEKHLSLELKLVVDIGIVGYPNCGKSTFLSRITSARPKIASYPFTTVSPCLGTLEFPDFQEPSLVTVVEIPALIKDAHQGKGLGTESLRHAERAKVLIHLIDMAAQEGRDPLEDYNSLNRELEIYNPQLTKKIHLLAANKMDLQQAEANLSKFSSQVKLAIYPISALTGAGIEQLLKEVRKHFR